MSEDSLDDINRDWVNYKFYNVKIKCEENKLIIFF